MVSFAIKNCQSFFFLPSSRILGRFVKKEIFFNSKFAKILVKYTKVLYKMNLLNNLQKKYKAVDIMRRFKTMIDAIQLKLEKNQQQAVNWLLACLMLFQAWVWSSSLYSRLWVFLADSCGYRFLQIYFLWMSAFKNDVPVCYKNPATYFSKK